MEQKHKNKNLGHKNGYDSDFDPITSLINSQSDHLHCQTDFAEKQINTKNMTGKQ